MSETDFYLNTHTGKTFRNGSVGAMIDEYEKAVNEFINVLSKTPESSFHKIVDEQTLDEDCRSIQTIAHHVINAGYTYANYFREYFDLGVVEHEHLGASISDTIFQIERMMIYTCETFENKWALSEGEISSIKITTRWNSDYDAEQLIEHAIVHVLRHRRQVEKFVLYQPSI